MEDEEKVWSGTPSQLVNIKCYVLCGLFFWTVLPLFFMYWKYLTTKNTKFEITSQRLLVQQGVFNKVTEQIELYRVKDIHLDEPILMRIFGLGNIRLNTSDKEFSEEVLPAMSNAVELKETIRNLVEALRVKRNVREMDFR
ncbi:MAG: PH domain-containing protein [Thiotrichales bacterium]|nr:PH domain-containing protein [Thiotrichales bacterium]